MVDPSAAQGEKALKRARRGAGYKIGGYLAETTTLANFFDLILDIGVVP